MFFFRAFTKNPFNYPPQLRERTVRGLYHSYLLKKIIHAFRAVSVTEQKTQLLLQKAKDCYSIINMLKIAER